MIAHHNFVYYFSNMNIGYHHPALDTVNAYRVIYLGYKNAFEGMWHEFHTYTAGMDLDKFLSESQIDIFFTMSHFFYRKQLDYAILRKYRDQWLKVFTKIDFWNSPMQDTGRSNEARSMSNDRDVLALMDHDLLGDYYYHVVEQWDERMSWFEQHTWKHYHTIPLCADKILLHGSYDSSYDADISFIGTYLQDKRQHISERIRPLQSHYNVKLYGKDWTWLDRRFGDIQRIWQYFNIPYLRSIRKAVTAENHIYGSTKICINIHEEYQKKYGWDCNDRTFRTLACGAFQITDDVACIHKYLEDGKEIVIAKDKQDWFEKINYYMHHPQQRAMIAQAGRERVLQDHTYHNRVQQILDIYHKNHVSQDKI